MIDLRSDTVTKPTDAMRTAAAEATVGDDVHREDPTVERLEAEMAELLGKQAGLYVPSGTMGNQVAALVHTTTGEEVIVERDAHIYGWEAGGLAALSGVQPRPLEGQTGGLFSPEQLAEAIVPRSMHRPGTALVCLENTHNHAGGIAHPAAAIEAVASVAHDADVPVHLDGARLFNAAVALETDPARLAAPAETVMCCLSKGLGAPVGSVLAGSTETIQQARRYRKRLGGGMRQAGIIAAPALEALADWPRLESDHRRAERLAEGLGSLPELAVQPPETNIVLLTVEDSLGGIDSFLETCATEGVRAVPFGGRTVRCCTHRDLTDADIEVAIEGIGRAVNKRR